LPGIKFIARGGIDIFTDWLFGGLRDE